MHSLTCKQQGVAPQGCLAQGGGCSSLLLCICLAAAFCSTVELVRRPAGPAAHPAVLSRTAGLMGTSAIGVLAKIESADSVEHLDEILDAGKRGAAGRCEQAALLNFTRSSWAAGAAQWLRLHLQKKCSCRGRASASCFTAEQGCL